MDPCSRPYIVPTLDSYTSYSFVPYQPPVTTGPHKPQQYPRFCGGSPAPILMLLERLSKLALWQASQGWTETQNGCKAMGNPVKFHPGTARDRDIMGMRDSDG